MIINKEVFKTGLCVVCGRPATQRHILGGCQQRKCELIERHDIIVNEIYKTIIERKLDNEYDPKLKCIKLKEGFLETGKMMGSVINDTKVSEFNQKPDILFVNYGELILIEVAVCHEDLVYQTTRKKQDKYKLLFTELIKLYKPKISRNITVVVTTCGIMTTLSREQLKEVNLLIDETKMLRDFLNFQFEYLMRKNKQHNFLIHNKIFNSKNSINEF